MDTLSTTYQISLLDNENQKKRTETFHFIFEEQSFELLASDNSETGALPFWTELEYRQCSHCPLSTDTHTHCPIASQLHQVVSRFDDCSSIDTVELEVITSDKRVIQNTDLQHAITSMLNLIFPSCGCPQTQKLKPLARFHLPMISEEEIIFRTTSMFLLGSYFRQDKNDETANFSQLTAFYQQMHILNKALASRLQTATQSDACKNAITLQDMYATLIPVLLEDQLVEMRQFFQDFILDDKKTSLSADTQGFSLSLSPLNEPSQSKAVYTLPDN
ncbi:MAG: hypothetical protein HRU20_07545 [Pseudomonadales bacterium]|nr:hypothetical protein [Pseudomonadales bacterium]